jgi:hypothetical protein
MKAEIKDKWVKALRSKKYKQAEGALREGTSHFCCLGVLCDIYRKETGVGKWEAYTEGPRDFITPSKNCEGFPSKPIYEWAGLHHSTGKRLATMNDHGATFEEIANHIEKKL